MDFPISFLLIFNSLCALVALFFIDRMLRAGSKYSWNPGDSKIQGEQRIIILQCILTLTVLGILAAIVNVLFI